MKMKQKTVIFFTVTFVFLIIAADTAVAAVAQEKEYFIDLKVVNAEGSEDGKSVTIGVEIANEGNLGSDDFLVTAKGPDRTWTTSEIRVEGGLDGGEIRKVELILRIPEEYLEGTKAFEVMVDPEGKSGDVNYENNRSTVWVTFPEKKPDLKKPDIEIRAADARVSEDENNLIFEVEYSNEGEAVAEEFSIIVGNPEQGWPDTQIEVLRLAAGEEAIAEGRVDILGEQRGKTLSFRAEIDPADNVDELDEENNIMWTSKITIPSKLPDIVIQDADAWVSEDENYLVIEFEIVNEGEGYAEGFSVSAESTEGKWQEVKIEIPGLGPEESIKREIELEIPKRQRGQSLTLMVEADPENEVEELDEKNNLELTAEIIIPKIPEKFKAPQTPKEVPSDGENGEFPWEAIVAITIAGGGIILTVKQAIKIRTRMGWEKNSVEKIPDKCQPHEEFCLKVKPKPRKITHLSLSAQDPASGKEKKEEVKGEVAEDLNRALLGSYINENPEKIRSLAESAASGILEKIRTWLEEETVPYDVSIYAHLEGSETTGQYIRYYCEEPNKPVEKEQWERSCKDEPDKKIGTLKDLIPLESGMPEKRITELTNLINEFIDKICLFPKGD